MADAYDRDRFGSGRRRRWNARELPAVGRAIARAHALGRPMRALLDLPCGTGRLFPLLGRDGHGFVGADVSLQMIEHARGKLAVGDRSEGGGLVQCDAERLPFKDRSFDAGVSLRFMLHLDRRPVGRCWPR